MPAETDKAEWIESTASPDTTRSIARLAGVGGYPVAWRDRDPDNSLWTVQVFCTSRQMVEIEELLYGGT